VNGANFQSYMLSYICGENCLLYEGEI
jgi:hypothetical protein